MKVNELVMFAPYTIGDKAVSYGGEVAGLHIFRPADGTGYLQLYPEDLDQVKAPVAPKAVK